jgi:hypothetical protein
MVDFVATALTTGDPVLGNPTLTVNYTFTITPFTSLPSFGALTSQYVLSIAPFTSQPSFGAMSTEYVLSIAPFTSRPSFGALTSQYVLSIDPFTSRPSFGAMTAQRGPADIAQILAARVVEPFLAVDLAFDSATLRVWTGLYDLQINGNTYIGAGQLLSISRLEEGAGLAAIGATLTMTGIPSEFLALALTEPYQGRACRIYFGPLISPDDMFEVFSGVMDQLNIEEGAESATITVTVESDLIALERPVVRRFTDEDQKTRFPDDKGLRYVAGLQDREIYWGRRTPK